MMTSDVLDYSITGQQRTAAPGREEAAASVGQLLAEAEDAHTGWESREVRKILASELSGWVQGLANWTSFVTLTFRENKFPDVAWSLFQWFVRQNNIHALGKHYTRKAGHSYFSYAVGMEYQTRDVVHFHVLVDKPIDYSYVHFTWGDRCGFAWIDTDLKDKNKVIDYVCKYVLKGGQVDVYKSKVDFTPQNPPLWWVDRSAALSRVVQGALFSPVQLAKPLTGDNKFSSSMEINTVSQR